MVDIIFPMICSCESQVALFLTSHSSTKGAVKAVTPCCHNSAGFGLSLAFVLSLSSR